MGKLSYTGTPARSGKRTAADGNRPTPSMGPGSARVGAKDRPDGKDRGQGTVSPVK